MHLLDGLRQSDAIDVLRDAPKPVAWVPHRRCDSFVNTAQLFGVSPGSGCEGLVGRVYITLLPTNNAIGAETTEEEAERRRWDRTTASRESCRVYRSSGLFTSRNSLRAFRCTLVSFAMVRFRRDLLRPPLIL
ncbi:hypothetical protein BHM03_00056900 [Ensete ventricosum]|nr:hypothetical protein BHM03_00056900 [Ensete ventricosum]